MNAILKAGSARTSACTTVFALSVALVLSGCGDEETADSAMNVGSATPATPRSELDSTPTEAATPTSSPTSAASLVATPGEALTGEACLPGNWFVDNETFGALMAEASGGVGNDMSGTVMVTFREDGTTSTYYDEWTYVTSVDGRTLTLLKDGADSGTYEVTADGSMSLVDTDISSTTSSQIEVDGEQVTMSIRPEPSVFSDASFTCEGDALTMTADGATTILHREH